MDLLVAVTLVSCLVGAILGVGLQRRFALRQGLVDIPNARSSHFRPLPSGGGLAIAIVASTGVAVLATAGLVSGRLVAALLIPGLLIAGVGYADDLRSVPVRTRLSIQLLAAGTALLILGGWNPASLPSGSGTWVVLQATAVVGIIWSVNLFNFMDGIDGLAGSEAVFLSLGAALLAWSELAGSGVPLVALVLAAACSGFLVWNWPPARIFMGDVGSGYLGLVFAVLAIESSNQRPLFMFVWAILGAAFLVDATTTLIRRMSRGDSGHEAHRTHAYQWLARRFRSHVAATTLYMAINVFWLLPIAWISLRLPERAHWFVVLALAPILVGALAAGAGRREGAPDR